MTRLAVVLFAALLVPASARALTPADRLRAVEATNAIGELRIEEAATLTQALVRADATAPEVRYLVGAVALYQGRYDEAVVALRDASARLRGTPQRRAAELLVFAEGAVTATEGYIRVRSADGRYEVAFHEGEDRLLAPYALDAVRRADDAIHGVLGYRVPGPIRLEIYQTPSELSRVSGLTVEAIERTGTIALCKWDRLMITSPRALARGYSWVDTISHELVHLVVARISRDHAPVWLQEGLAKYLERTFRTGRPALATDPSSEALLVRAAREGRLLPFESFHPSIAMLPSQEDAALAFAQVSTLIAIFHGRNGDDGLRRLLAEVARDVDPRAAIAAIESTPFETFYELVFEDVKRRPTPPTAPEMLPLRFTRRGPVPEDDVRDVRVREAARHVRLGDMLWSAGRAGAAAVEYERAATAAPGDPIVGSRLARAALEAGQPDRAIAASRRIIERYPTHAPAWAVLAQAQRLKNENEAAVSSAFEAIRQNPFDPAPHCVLAEAFTDVRGRASAEAACRSLRRH